MSAGFVKRYLLMLLLSVATLLLYLGINKREDHIENERLQRILTRMEKMEEFVKRLRESHGQMCKLDS